MLADRLPARRVRAVGREAQAEDDVLGDREPGKDAVFLEDDAALRARPFDLGAVIQNASSFFRLDTIYVGIISIGAIALVMDLALRDLTRRLVAWQERIAA